MCGSGQKTGPQVDVEFFADLQRVFANHPDASQKYAIRTLTDNNGGTKVDFQTHVAVSKCDGRRVVTEYLLRDFDSPDEGDAACCGWATIGGHLRCVEICRV